MIKDNQEYNDQVIPNTEFLNRLHETFPQFFDKDDQFDLEKFQNNLLRQNIHEVNDGYRLDFIGKDYARKQVGELPQTVIVPDESNKNDSQNLFFTGDNLNVLRHLQQNYANKIDVIYIDPPYNTGNDGFSYEDKFEYKDDQLKDMLSLDDDALKRLKSIQGKSTHSAWLTSMYPRLALAKRLLNDTGVIFISIDDNEVANLKLLMNEIYGEKQFKAQFVWTKTSTPPSLSQYTRQTTEYVLAYEKNEFTSKYYGSELDNADTPLRNSGNGVKQIVFPVNSCDFRFVDNVVIDPAEFKNVKLLTPIDIKNGQNEKEFTLEFESRWSQEKIEAESKEGTRFIFKTKDLNPRFQYAETSDKYRAPNSNLNKEVGVLTNETANTHLKDLGLGNMFTNPKPVSLVKYLINMVTKNKKDAVVMDFFAGSSTTAEAVMRLNAEDGGTRKFIMVQRPEKTYEYNDKKEKFATKGNKIAFDAGYMSLDEISRARITFAADAIKSDDKLDLKPDLDLEFKSFWVVEPNVNTVDEITAFDPNNYDLFTDMITPFSSDSLQIPGKATGIDTILTTWLAEDGYDFNTKIDWHNFDGATVPIVDENRIYLIDDRWKTNNTKELVNQIGTRKVMAQTVVVYGYSLNTLRLKELEIALKQLDTTVSLIKRY